MHTPTPPRSSHLSKGSWWGIGLAVSAIVMLVAGILAVLRPSSGADWSLGPGAPRATSVPAFDLAALADVLEQVESDLPEGSEIASLYVDSYGDGWVDSCDPNGEPIDLYLTGWELTPSDSQDGCPPLLSFDEIDLAAVALALETAGPPAGSLVEVMLGDLGGLAEPSNVPYILIAIDEYDEFLFTMDAEPYDGGLGYGGLELTAEDAATAVAEIVSAADLTTASTLCGDSDYGDYTVIGQPTSAPDVTQEWVHDGSPWQLDEWPTSGLAPLPIESMDLPGAIDRIDELSVQWAHNFPVSSVCVNVSEGGTHQVTYRGYAASIEHTVVTDQAGVILSET